MKVLLIGNGAREHAMAKALVAGRAKLTVLMTQLNPGIAQLSEKRYIGDLTNIALIKNLSEIDFAVIGPESPLAAGLVDVLAKYNVPTVGPSKTAAQIEASKAFTRELLTTAKISGNPEYYICKNEKDVREAINLLEEKIAVKPDGLTGGKGVRLSGEHLGSTDEIIDYSMFWIKKEGKVILQKQLYGQEFTLQAFCDGKTLEWMPLVKDYKRAFENDKGPNTGSMGSYSCINHTLPFLNPTIIEQAKLIMKETINGLYTHYQVQYKGILYGQFMITPANKVYLIEYNVRFGDPEGINVLSLLQSNYIDLCTEILDQRLKEPEFIKKATIYIYIVPEGYPNTPISDSPIIIPENLKNEIYYASVYSKENNNPNIIYTTTSRAIGVLAHGDTIESARENALAKAQQIHGQIFYRKDIGANIRC